MSNVWVMAVGRIRHTLVKLSVGATPIRRLSPGEMALSADSTAGLGATCPESSNRYGGQ